MKVPDLKKCKKGPGHTGENREPDADLRTPDANVGMEGQCLVPPHPEAARPDTGEPCDDGRGAGE